MSNEHSPSSYMTPAERAVDEVNKSERRRYSRKVKAKEIGFKALVGAGLVTAVLAGLGGVDKEGPDLPVGRDNAVEHIVPMTENEIDERLREVDRKEAEQLVMANMSEQHKE